MSKEQNIKVYNRAYEYLLSIKPEGVELDNYFYGDSKNFKSLKDIYIQFITSAQNYQRMPKVIKYSQRKSDVSEMLFNYDIQQITEMRYSLKSCIESSEIDLMLRAMTAQATVGTSGAVQ